MNIISVKKDPLSNKANAFKLTSIRIIDGVAKISENKSYAVCGKTFTKDMADLDASFDFRGNATVYWDQEIFLLKDTAKLFGYDFRSKSFIDLQLLAAIGLGVQKPSLLEACKSFNINHQEDSPNISMAELILKICRPR